MVVANTPQSHPDLGPDDVIYEELAGGVREEDRIWHWEKAQELRSGKCTLWDHCFELPDKHLEATKTTLDSVQLGRTTHKLKTANDSLELYDYPGGYAQRFDGGARAEDLPGQPAHGRDPHAGGNRARPHHHGLERLPATSSPATSSLSSGTSPTAASTSSRRWSTAAASPSAPRAISRRRSPTRTRSPASPWASRSARRA